MGQNFQVLTEFKFDATDAIAKSKVLESSVDGISQAADRALGSLQGLAAGAVATLGLGSLLGTLKSAVSVSDQFQSSVLDFSSVIATNMQYLQGSVGSFNDRLGATQEIMKNIGKTADQLDLSQGDLFSVVKATVPGMLPHGAAGDNFKNAIGLSSQALVAGGNIGLGRADVSSQLVALLGGSATEGGLAGRLAGTKAFKGTSVSDFNALDFEKRMKMLSAGLNELGSDMGYLSASSNLLSTQFKKMKELIFGDSNGMGSILKPLGDVLRPAIVNSLKSVNSYLKNEGAAIVGNFTQLARSMLASPQKMIIDLLQFKALRSDFHEAVGITKTVGTVTGIGAAIGWLTGKAIFASPMIGVLAGVISLLGSVAGRMHDPISDMIATFLQWTVGIAAVSSALAYFGVLGTVLAFVLGEILIPLGLFTIMLQALSRAKAQAQVHDAEDMARLAPHLSELFVRLKMAFHNIMSPIEDAISGLANIFEPLFRWSGWLELMMPLIDGFVKLMEMLGFAITYVMAGIAALTNVLIGFVFDLMHMTNPLTNIGSNAKEGFNDYLKSHQQKMDDGGNVANSVVNIGRVEIRNDFKETQEPDRIAFTMKEQILKAAQNPKQARGQASQLGFAQR
jgi:hypothetical protein